MNTLEVIQILKAEKERCFNAPGLNGCAMTPEWEKAIEICDICIGALEAMEVPAAPTRKSILDTALKCVCGDREQDYGSPENNFRTIANFWVDYLNAKEEPLNIMPYDVAAMLGLLKIARIATGHGKADNWVDLAGYAACGGEIEGGNA